MYFTHNLNVQADEAKIKKNSGIVVRQAQTWTEINNNGNLRMAMAVCYGVYATREWQQGFLALIFLPLSAKQGEERSLVWCACRVLLLRHLIVLSVVLTQFTTKIVKV
jgi:hypothetical protein